MLCYVIVRKMKLQCTHRDNYDGANGSIEFYLNGELVCVVLLYRRKDQFHQN